MERIDDLLRYVVAVLEERELPYAVAGSVGMMAYGESRGTMDIDVVIQMSSADVAPLLSRFTFPDYCVDARAAHEAVETGSSFNVLHGAMKVDVFTAGGEIERNQVLRARRMRAFGTRAMISPPEELIVKKLEYYDRGGSDKHLRDIAGMLRVSWSDIDLARVEAYARRLQLAELWDLVMKSWEEGEGAA